MNYRCAIWLALSLMLWPLASPAADFPVKKYTRELSVNADKQEAFYPRFPDLTDERDLVANVGRTLGAENRIAEDEAAAAELLATRVREKLARRTPQEWQRKAVSLFPELGVAGSEFNTLFLQHFRELERTSPAFMKEPSWSVLLARRTADELRVPAPTAAEPARVPGSTPIPATATVKTAPRAHFWSSLLSVFVLLGVIALPARWLYRCGRAFAGDEAPHAAWQRALIPAAWTFFVFAVIAMARTFAANADQGLLDRFGITLLVSLLAGALFALPAYGLALATFWWQRHRTSWVENAGAPEEPRPAPADATGRKA